MNTHPHAASSAHGRGANPAQHNAGFARPHGLSMNWSHLPRQIPVQVRARVPPRPALFPRRRLPDHLPPLPRFGQLPEPYQQFGLQLGSYYEPHAPQVPRCVVVADWHDDNTLGYPYTVPRYTIGDWSLVFDPNPISNPRKGLTIIRTSFETVMNRPSQYLMDEVERLLAPQVRFCLNPLAQTFRSSNVTAFTAPATPTVRPSFGATDRAAANMGVIRTRRRSASPERTPAQASSTNAHGPDRLVWNATGRTRPTENSSATPHANGHPAPPTVKRPARFRGTAGASSGM